MSAAANKRDTNGWKKEVQNLITRMRLRATEHVIASVVKDTEDITFNTIYIRNAIHNLFPWKLAQALHKYLCVFDINRHLNAAACTRAHTLNVNCAVGPASACIDYSLHYIMMCALRACSVCVRVVCSENRFVGTADRAPMRHWSMDAGFANQMML